MSRHGEQEQTGPLLPRGSSNLTPSSDHGHDGKDVIPPRTFLDKTIFAMNISALALAVFALLFIVFLCGLNSRSNYFLGLYDWDFYWLAGQHLGVAFFLIPYTILNIVFFRFKNQPFYSWANALVFGLCTSMTYPHVVDLMFTQFGVNGMDCEMMHDHPKEHDHPNGQIPGTYEDCIDWVQGYNVVIWLYIVTDFLLANTCLVLTVTSITKVIKNWSQTVRLEVDSIGRRAIHIPAGKFSLEVAVRWGADAQQGATPQRVTSKEDGAAGRG